MRWRCNRRLLVAVIIAFLAMPAAAASTTVTLLHFSDYHSHAQPFYSEGRAEQGGLARAVGYMKREKRAGALVFNGGDMMNKGAPAWSDRNGCVEWPWLNGVVDAMALGNHDADYGWDAFKSCRDSVRYPILSANTSGFPRFVVLKSRGMRIGVFAVAGSDFSSLMKLPELKFSDSVTAARETVRQLREVERVNAVVLIGHEHNDDDYALARAVPGIDVIFGTHSHARHELERIPDTGTWFISPFQYLAYVSRVELTFDGGALSSVRGGLVPVDRRMPLDKAVAGRIATLQRELEKDPKYAQLFVPFATLEKPIPVETLGLLAVDAMREAAPADVGLSTISSFRQALPSGPIDLETLRAAMPYDNEIVVAEMTPEAWARLRDLARSRAGTDSELYIAGEPAADATIITVATTDYMARVAAGYRDIFATGKLRNTGARVREIVREHIAPAP